MAPQIVRTTMKASRMALQACKTTLKTRKTAPEAGGTTLQACTTEKMAGIEPQRVRYLSFQAYFTTETPRSRRKTLEQ